MQPSKLVEFTRFNMPSGREISPVFQGFATEFCLTATLRCGIALKGGEAWKKAKMNALV
jgi:hypothetical protein